MRAMGWLVSLVVAVWSVWIAIDAFKGGHPPLFYTFHGFSFGRGIAYLLIGEPLLLLAVFVVFRILTAFVVFFGSLIRNLR